MSVKRYKILLDNEVVAEEMDIDTALILVKALFEKYYCDNSMVIIIKEMEHARARDDR